MKFSIVLNPGHPLSTQLNALGHVCVGLSDLAPPPSREMRSFRDADDVFVASMTDHPLIVLTARNATQIRQIYSAAQAQALNYNVFCIDMKDGLPADQEAAVRDKTGQDLDIVAIGIFGDGDTLRDLTKKCSLFRA